MRCDRCKKEAKSLRCSMFNTQMCCEECIKKEQGHPLYQTAKERERESVLNGNYNFEGIGLPDDLK